MTSDVIDIEPTTAALAVYQGSSALVEPAASIGDITRAFASYQNLVKTLLNDSDYQSLGRTRFVKKSGWRKLAVAFGVSCELISRDIERFDDGAIRRAEVVVRATAPNGRTMDGLGICSIKERSFGNKAEHDIPATAMTRATNRACSDLFGFGDVSAEEMQAEREEDAMETWRPAPKARVDALAADVKEAPAAFRAWVKAEFAWPWSAESCDEIEAAFAAADVPGVDGGEPESAGSVDVASSPAQQPTSDTTSRPAPGTDPETEPF